ncbi:winged helix-turn-helix transcriptional regulator [Pedobacter chinensis]|uniref:winged helix-turn-helix transcriptional regulator n=1 Tax=Pedobacter chinensis TaxID=2282421 RepID=UPI001F3D01F5|nr:winged helix-turn-helix transcriptional regulator [Pedobacter chinensis]
MEKRMSFYSRTNFEPAMEKMEATGLITRTVHMSKPPLKVDYQLTDFGKTLIPLLQFISQWGMETAKINNKDTVDLINYLPLIVHLQTF